MQTITRFLLPVFLTIYTFILDLSNDIYAPALPIVERFFNVTPTLAKLSITIWFIGGMLSQLFEGVLTDKYGQRKILLISGIIFLISTYLCSVVQYYIPFMIYRFMQGFAVSPVIVSTYAIIYEHYKGKDIALMLSFISAALVTAPMLGPIAGTTLLSITNWHNLFAILVYAGLTITTALWFTIPSASKVNTKSIVISDFYLPLIGLAKDEGFLLHSIIASMCYSVTIAWIVCSPFLLITQHNFSSIEYGKLQILIFSSYFLGMMISRFYINKYPKNYLLTLGTNLLLV